MARLLRAALAAVTLTLALIGPVAAGGSDDCDLTLEVDRTYAYGETVVVHVSGLPGVGGIDIYTRHGRLVDEAHYFLFPGTTEFDHTYGPTSPEEELIPLEPGHYIVEAHAFGCDARTTFHVTRP